MLIGCKLNKKIDLELPPYDAKTVVECYLEPGKPYQMLLTKSVSYFDSLNPIVKNIFITITHNGKIDTLRYHASPILDTTSLKLFFHYSPTIVQADYDNPYSLFIKDSTGRIYTSTATLKKPLKIDTIMYSYSTKATHNVSLKVRFKDDPIQTNFYRLIVTINGLIYQSLNTDDLITDLNLTTPTIERNIIDRFSKNDTLIVTLAEISKDFYDFSKSISAAEKANGNPFVQPASIKSNITGEAIGIFTGFSYIRDTIIIK